MIGNPMEKRITINNELYNITAVFTCPHRKGRFPVVILCHGTASTKDEVGNLFVKLAKSLKERGIASIRFDFAGCGESLAKPEDLTSYGEVKDTEKVYSYLYQHDKVDSSKIGILGFSQGGSYAIYYS